MLLAIVFQPYLGVLCKCSVSYGKSLLKGLHIKMRVLGEHLILVILDARNKDAGGLAGALLGPSRGLSGIRVKVMLLSTRFLFGPRSRL